MEAFLIIMSIVVSILFLLLDFSIMAFYSHKQESNLSIVNLFCKFLIMLTLLQTQFQPFFLIIDVANSRSSGDDLTLFWLVLYLTLMANLAVLKPIATSLYQRDYDDPCWKSLVWIFFEIIVSLGIIGLFIGVGWSLWGIASIPLDLVEVKAANYSVSVSSQIYTYTSSHLQFNSTIICFVVAFFCVLGYPILACCGACGLTVLPITYILQFINRPTFRKTADARKVADFLKVQTVRLLREEQRLKREVVRVESAEGFFQKRKQNRKFDAELKQVQGQVQTHKDFYQLFKLQLQFKTINPIVYYLQLIVGILSIFFSIILWIQILLSQFVYPYKSGYPSIFLDKFFNFLEQQNANFISIGFLTLICFYMTFAIIKGSVFFSNSIPFIVIHPIVQGKTWLNSFLFHLTLCAMSAASLIHMLSQTFPYYLRGGSIVILLDSLLGNMKVVGWLLSKKVFSYWFLAVGCLGVIYVSYKLICATQSKGELLKRIEAKRAKIFSKENKDKTLTFIEMTDMKMEK